MKTINMNESDRQWKVKALAIGALVGMVIGLGTAYLQVRDAENHQKIVKYDMKSTARFGMTLFELIKKII